MPSVIQATEATITAGNAVAWTNPSPEARATIPPSTAATATAPAINSRLRLGDRNIAATVTIVAGAYDHSS